MGIRGFDIDEYGITADQFHAGLDKLWNAIHLTQTQDKDIFTLVADYIKKLEDDLELAKDQLSIAYER